MTYDRDKLIRQIFRDSSAVHLKNHGPDHWYNVAAIGAQIARAEGVDPVFCEIFGLLHDCQRISDYEDEGHGKRAALYAGYIRDLIPLNDADFRKLCYALRLHDDGFVTKDKKIGACWDADRLDLPRIDMQPSASMMSTKTGKNAARSRPKGGDDE